MQRAADGSAAPELLTVMFTDIVASTEFTAARGEEAARRARAAHDALIRRSLRRHGGSEVQTTGDGFLLTFGSVRRALECAAEIQRALAAEGRRSPSDTFQVRIGLHVGEVTRRDDGLFGTAVNVASRITGQAAAAQVLASEIVARLGGGDGAELRHVGEAELKGLDGSWPLYELRWDAGEQGSLPLPPAVADQGQMPFVGRGEALADLETTWAEARSGEVRLALLSGEPGIGKTTLASEFARRAHAGGAHVLFGRCDEEPLLPYQPFSEALRYYATVAPDHDRLPGLGKLAPELGEEPAAGGLPDLEAERHALFEAVEELLARLAAGAPVVLLLDDLHWADRATLLLVRHLARSRRRVPLLLLGTYRDTDLDRRHPLAELLADLRRERGFLRVRLAGLTLDEVRDAMERAAGHRFSGRGLEIPEALWRETEGNPFFLGEMVRHLVETGKFFQRDGRWAFAGEVEELGLPEGIREVIGRRLNRLSPACNTVLGIASVLGQQFEFRVLRRMGELADSEVETALEEALQAQLLIAAAGSALPVYSFTHSLVRQVLYEELSLPRAQRLHLAAAGALEQEHQGDLDTFAGQIAAHLQQAGVAADPGDIFRHSVRAARLAQKASAYEDAARHWQAALDAWAPGRADPQERARADEMLGDLMYATGYDWEAGIRHLQAALSQYEESGRPDRAARVHAKLGRSLSSYWDHCDIPRAIEHFRAAEQVLDGLGDHPARLHLLTSLATAYLYAYQFEAGAREASEGLALAERLGDEQLWAEAAMLQSFYLAADGRMAEAVETSERAHSIALAGGNALALFLTGWFVMTVHWFAGNPARCIEVCDEMLGRRLPPIQHRTALVLRAMSSWAAGDPAAVRRDAAAVTEDVIGRSYLQHADGRWGDLLADEGVVELERQGNLWIASAIHWLRGDALAAMGERERALVELEGIDRGHIGTRLGIVGRRALLRLESEPAEAVREDVEVIRDVRARTGGWFGMIGWADAVEGVALAAEGGPEAGRALFEAGVDRFRAHRQHWYEVAAIRSWVCQLRRHGESAEAALWLQRASDALQGMAAGEPWLETLSRI